MITCSRVRTAVSKFGCGCLGAAVQPGCPCGTCTLTCSVGYAQRCVGAQDRCAREVFLTCPSTVPVHGSRLSCDAHFSGLIVDHADFLIIAHKYLNNVPYQPMPLQIDKQMEERTMYMWTSESQHCQALYHADQPLDCIAQLYCTAHCAGVFSKQRAVKRAGRIAPANSVLQGSLGSATWKAPASA